MDFKQASISPPHLLTEVLPSVSEFSEGKDK